MHGVIHVFIFEHRQSQKNTKEEGLPRGGSGFNFLLVAKKGGRGLTILGMPG